MTAGIARDERSVECRLYEAYRLGKSLQLTAAEVESLVGNDDAMQTRILNVAAEEAGCEVGVGGDFVAAGGDFSAGLTWNQLKKRLSQ